MMTTLAGDRKSKGGSEASNQALARQRAALAVILGAPPAAIAADIGCDVGTLMGWVRAQRQILKAAARPAARPDTSADDEPMQEPIAMRPIAKRMLPCDRQVAPENSALVDAAYRSAEFDYSGRRVRPQVTH